MTSTASGVLQLPEQPALRGPQKGRLVRRFVASRRAFFGASVLGTVVLLILVLPVLLPYQANVQNVRENFRPPFASGSGGIHLIGTDVLGRDLLARLLIGGRVSLLLSLAAGTLACVFGVSMGLLAGYFGGRVDQVIMRAVDVELAIPGIILAMGLMASLGPGVQNVILALAISAWIVYARTVRSSVLGLRDAQFADAARSLGANPLRIIVRHILPNCLTPIIVISTQQTAQLIIIEASLSFLGIGVPAEVPSWGKMIAEGRSYLTSAWWIITVPGTALMLTTLALNFFGDGLRDVLDPRLRLS